MRHVAGRVGMVAALLLATAYLLQLDDSVRASTAPPQPVSVTPPLVAQSDSGGREYFIRHHDVIPVGTEAIQLPILMYHYIRTPPSYLVDPMGYKLSVSPEDFRAQMSWLYLHRYHAVTFNQVRAYFAGTEPLPSQPIVITFDDGYQDFYTTAYPILRSFGFTGVTYVVTSFVGQPNYVSSSEVLEMDRAGIEIASHTVRHADLAKMSYGGAVNEVSQSKRWLEQLLGHPVLDFAYPSGKFNLQTIEAVRQAGYDTAVTTQASVTHRLVDRYVWGRVRVGGGESLEEFITNLGSSMPSVRITHLDITSH